MVANRFSAGRRTRGLDDLVFLQKTNDGVPAVWNRGPFALPRAESRVRMLDLRAGESAFEMQIQSGEGEDHANRLAVRAQWPSAVY
jgi:hypothetical protein